MTGKVSFKQHTNHFAHLTDHVSMLKHLDFLIKFHQPVHDLRRPITWRAQGKLTKALCQSDVETKSFYQGHASQTGTRYCEFSCFEDAIFSIYVYSTSLFLTLCLLCFVVDSRSLHTSRAWCAAFHSSFLSISASCACFQHTNRVVKPISGHHYKSMKIRLFNMGSTQHSSSTRNHSQRSHTKRKHRSVRQALLWLHSFNALLAFTALALFAIVIPLWNANFFHKTGMVKGDCPDALPILTLFITFITRNTFI